MKGERECQNMKGERLPSSERRHIQDTSLHGRAAAVLASCEVWDMTLPWLRDQQELETLARFHKAGFTFVSATAEDFPPTIEGVLDCIRSFRRAAASASGWLTFADTLADIDAGRRAGKLVMGFNVQDTVQLGADISRIQTLRAAGVRHMLLAYNVRNFVADGCAETGDAGLSNFGRRVVKEMNKVGMVVDCSHTGRRSSLEAIELSSLSPIFSHSGAAAVCRHIRNIDDEQIRACAARAGVIGIVGIGAFIGDPTAATESVFRHIDHVVQLVGDAHVGLGTDFVRDMGAVWRNICADKEAAWPDPTGTQLYAGGCFQPEQLLELVVVMLEHAYAEDSVRRILGGNFRRIYEAADRAAVRAQST